METPKIELRNLRKFFGSQPVLRDVNLTVCPGETLVIIGRSGCGKSVTLKNMIGLIKPDSGSILIDGEDITRYDEEGLYRVRKKFGFLFQGAALLDSLTVGENVGLGLKENTVISPGEIRRIVCEKLSMVGMDDTYDLMPAELSGGMKKRVGLARAIAMEPEIVLYDEPTTGLDPIMSDSINELILSMKHDLHITSIVVTHDITSARKVADRIAMLHHGGIIFHGGLEELDSTDNEVVRQFIEGTSKGPIKPAFQRRPVGTQ